MKPADYKREAALVLADMRADRDRADADVDSAKKEGVGRLARFELAWQRWRSETGMAAAPDPYWEAQRISAGQAATKPWPVRTLAEVEEETKERVGQAKRLASVAQLRLDGATQALYRIGLLP